MGETFDHNVFQNDPLKFQTYIDKYVIVSLKNLSTVSGFVQAVDPVSESVIILTSDEASKVILIMGAMIRNIEISDNTTAKPNFNVGVIEQQPNITSVECEDRKRKIISWLSKNLLPVKDAGTHLEVNNGVLQIVPPFRTEDCVSQSAVVLGRIQHLLQNMPTE